MSDSIDPRDEALAAFVDKWRARWPEWAVAQVFVPHAQRTTALAWAALLQELTDAAWGGQDSRPGEAKLAWWQEELQGWTRGIRRHPLGAALVRGAGQRGTSRPDPVYAMLAAALPALRESRERPGNTDEAFASLRPVASAIAAIERELFAMGDATETDEATATSATLSLLHARLAQTGAASVPLRVLARAGEPAAAAAWARELLQRLPETRTGTRPRRVWTALATQRLRGGDAAKPLRTWRALWAAWDAARG